MGRTPRAVRGEETRRAEVTDFIYSLYPQVLSAFYYGHIIVHMAPNEAEDTETFGQRTASEAGVVKEKKMEAINEGSEWTHEGLCGEKSLKPTEPSEMWQQGMQITAQLCHN